MIYVEINPQQWSLNHAFLPLSSDYCRKCGIKVEVNIPVIAQDFVGFESLSHEPCGSGYVISILKPYSVEMKKLMQDA